MMFIERIEISEEEYKKIIENLQRQEKELGDEAERFFHLREAMEGIKEIRERYFPFSE